MKLYNHQLEVINKDPKKIGLFLGTGSGKSATALALCQGRTLVICPKILRDDKTWQRNWQKMADSNIPTKITTLSVMSKEDFRRDYKSLVAFDSVIVDEAHLVSGVNPDVKWVNKEPRPKASQLFEAITEYLAKKPPSRLYLLTATPTKNAMCVWGLSQMLGYNWSFYEFREMFYVPVRMNFREIWMPKKDEVTQEKLGALVRKLGVTGKLDDWFDVPPQTHKIINVDLTTAQKAAIKELPTDYPDPLVLVGKKHQVEQGVLKGNEFEKSKVFGSNKLEHIEDLYEEFGKVLVFARYKEQIEMIANHFKDEPVLVLTGDTKDRDTIMSAAELSPRIIFIAQSSISAGYELPSFRCTIFASMDYSIVNYTQALGRTLRVNNLQKNLYVYLLAGEIDKAIYKAIENKEDFNEAIYSKVIYAIK